MKAKHLALVQLYASPKRLDRLRWLRAFADCVEQLRRCLAALEYAVRHP